MMMIEPKRNRELKYLIYCSYRPQNKRILCPYPVENTFLIVSVLWMYLYVEHGRCLQDECLPA